MKQLPSHWRNGLPTFFDVPIGNPVDAAGSNPRRFAAGSVSVDPVNAKASIA